MSKAKTIGIRLDPDIYKQIETLAAARKITGPPRMPKSGLATL